MGIADTNEWKAYVPVEVDQPLRDRIVAVQVPALSIYQKDREEVWTKEGAGHQEITNDKKMMTAIETNPDRKYITFFVVFPPGVVLDNFVWAGPGKNSLYKLSIRSTNKCGKAETAATVKRFTIAEKGGSAIHNTNDEDDDDLEAHKKCIRTQNEMCPVTKNVPKHKKIVTGTQNVSGHKIENPL